MVNEVTLIDSHAHITSDTVFGEVAALLDRAQKGGVAQIINICTDRATLERGIALKRLYPWIHNAGATTPHDVEKEGEALFPLFEYHAKNGDLIAIGETGLDYFHHHSPREIQKAFLRRYLKLALDCRLPVIIHCRDAFADFFDILDQEYVKDGKHAPGVLHCFTGNVDEANEVIQRDWHLSLSGIVTFKKSGALRDVAAMVPLERLLIETDTPYLAPHSHRGKINEPAYLAETASLIASIRGIAVEELADATSANARRLFRLNR